MKPSWTIQLDKVAFGGASAVCTGNQVATVIATIDKIAPRLTWYIADIQAIGQSVLCAKAERSVRVGDASDLIEKAQAVIQFESGVFMGVPATNSNPKFRRGGVWTEDAEDADLEDAVVEVRAFDTTYISVASVIVGWRPRLLKALAAAGVNP